MSCFYICAACGKIIDEFICEVFIAMNGNSESIQKSTPEASKESRIAVQARRVLLSVLAGLAALAVFWCGYLLFSFRAVPEMAEYAGEYSAAYTQTGNIRLSEGMPLTAVLDAGGKCTLSLGERSYSGRWTLRGGGLRIWCGTAYMRGTLDGDVLTLENVFGSGTAVSLSRGGDGYTPPSSGKYVVSEISADGESYAKNTVDEAGAGEWYVLINDDGSAEARLFAAEAQSASFMESGLIYGQLLLDYSLDGNALIIEYPDGVVLRLVPEKD